MNNAYILLEQFADDEKALIVKMYAESISFTLSDKGLVSFEELLNAYDEHLSENEKRYDKDHKEMKEWKNNKATHKPVKK